jgi:DNA-binding CsgD family transcriptional regulator
MTDDDAAITGELTPREGEVLAMVAAGLTNREIGEALFMSESTAGVHVSHIMAKLGVGSRTEAAAWAYRAGLVDTQMSAISTEGPPAGSATSDAATAPSGWWARLQARLRGQLRQHPSRVAALGIAGVMVLAVIATALAIAVLGGARPVAGNLPSASGSPTVTPSASASASATIEPSEAPSHEESPIAGSPSPTPIPLPNGTWSATGTMSVNRESATATLLRDGTVLVVGGVVAPGDTLASAELYDPQSGEWTTTGEMVGDRHSHSATLLNDGTVLVAGGISIHFDLGAIPQYLATAELFDPVSGTWHAAPPMKAAHAWHTATLLADGTVLVAGGSANGTLTSPEIYDPRTATWTTVPQMPDPRVEHTATLLNDGRVLVAGGQAMSGASIARGALYDPDSRTWSAAGRMITGRHGHTATLLNDGTVLVAGGQSDIGPQASAEAYQPSTNSWTATGSLAAPRTSATATLLDDGTVLVAGGVIATSISASAEVYDPRTGQWTPTASMPQGRASQLAILLTNGQVLVLGGSWSGVGLPQVTFLYVPD